MTVCLENIKKVVLLPARQILREISEGVQKNIDLRSCSRERLKRFLECGRVRLKNSSRVLFACICNNPTEFAHLLLVVSYQEKLVSRMKSHQRVHRNGSPESTQPREGKNAGQEMLSDTQVR